MQCDLFELRFSGGLIEALDPDAQLTRAQVLALSRGRASLVAFDTLSAEEQVLIDLGGLEERPQS